MNKPARWWSVERSERSQRRDTVLCRLSLPFIFRECLNKWLDKIIS